MFWFVERQGGVTMLCTVPWSFDCWPRAPGRVLAYIGMIPNFSFPHRVRLPSHGGERTAEDAVRHVSEGSERVADRRKYLIVDDPGCLCSVGAYARCSCSQATLT